MNMSEAMPLHPDSEQSYVFAELNEGFGIKLFAK